MTKFRIWIEVLLLAVLAAIFAGRGFVPAWRSLNTDFPNYYVAARLYIQGDSMARVYDWIWFQRQKDHTGMERRVVEFIPHTPYSAMAIVPLASLPPLQAKRYWLVINLGLLIFSALLLNTMTDLGGIRIAILVLLATEPLRTQFMYGQLHIVVLLLIVLALWLYLKDRSIASGVTLALAAAVKIYPILFVFYFVRKRQWRVVTGLVCGCIVLAVLSIGLFGVELNRVYVEQVLPRVVRGEAFDPYSLNWNSVTALLYRLFVFEPQLNPHPLANMPLAYAVLQPAMQGLLFIPLLWLLTPGRAPAGKEKLEFGVYVAALLVLSTNPASYHYVVLIACAVLVADYLHREKRNTEAILFAALYTLASLPTHWPGEAPGPAPILTSSSRLVFSLGLFLLLLVILTSLAMKTWRERLQSPAALVFLPMFLIMVSTAAADNFRHIRSQLDYSARIEPQSESLLQADPSASEKRIAFTKLRLPGYTLGTVEGKQLSTLATDADLFHLVAIPHSSQALAELAGRTSRIVRIDLDEQPVSDAPFAIEVEDGEWPAVSPDGRWLAFIREVHGRGSLWVKRLAQNDEWKLVGPEYDVLEAVFAANGSEIIFAAQPHGGPALFTVERESSLITQNTFGAASRYPAVSPDGRWIAYSRLMKGNWQIWLKPRHEGLAERQLTTAECNSISPAFTPDSKDLVYATDCGRGWGMTALARIRAVP